MKKELTDLFKNSEISEVPEPVLENSEMPEIRGEGGPLFKKTLSYVWWGRHPTCTQESF